MLRKLLPYLRKILPFIISSRDKQPDSSVGGGAGLLHGIYRTALFLRRCYWIRGMAAWLLPLNFLYGSVFSLAVFLRLAILPNFMQASSLKTATCSTRHMPAGRSTQIGANQIQKTVTKNGFSVFSF